MRELAFVGFVALLFALGSERIQGEFGLFGGANLTIAIVALGAAAVAALRGARSAARSAPGGPWRRALLGVVAVLVGAVAVERAVASQAWSADWTFEGEYDLADATREALLELPDLELTLYRDGLDPRIRRTRLLLERMATVNGAVARQREIEEFPEDEDRFGIGSSNSVVLASGDRWELVERPTEGALFEALSKLRGRAVRKLYVTVGTGEGSIASVGELGYSGLAAALETEGYVVEPFPTAFATEIPGDADAVLVIAPARRLQAEALATLGRYLQEGGRLIAMLEPDRETGVEALLADWGLRTPAKILVDPASASLQGEAPGSAPVAFNYADHPVTRGLNRNRVTFFRGTRSFELRKPEIEDRIRAVVTGSAGSWLSADPAVLEARELPLPTADDRTDYHPIAVAGAYARGTRETRIVAFGDADFASNRYLRALYNLDLVVNAVHWATEREREITLRPKSGTVVQFPVPIQNSLGALYGAGLLVPELLLIGGGLSWVRRRGA